MTDSLSEIKKKKKKGGKVEGRSSPFILFGLDPGLDLFYTALM